jgi:predicted transcriptional regulator
VTLEVLKIENYMDKTFATLNADMDVYTAIQIMVDKGLTGAVVVDGDHKVVGILSEKDCLRLMTKGSYHEMPEGKVKDFMTKEVFCAPPYTDVFKIAELLLNNLFRRIPITDERNVMLGQITRKDLLRVIREIHDKQVDKGTKKPPIM